MKGELRHLVESDIFVVDYYENITQSHEDRMDALREDLELVFRYGGSPTIEVYMYNVKPLEKDKTPEIFKQMFDGYDPSDFSNEDYEFVEINLNDMEEFTLLVGILSEICEDFTIDEIRFTLDEKRKMWFGLGETVDRVVDF